MDKELKEIEEKIAQYPAEFRGIVVELMNQVSQRNQMIAWLRTELQEKEKLTKEKEETLKEITTRLLETERKVEQGN